MTFQRQQELQAYLDIPVHIDLSQVQESNPNDTADTTNNAKLSLILDALESMYYFQALKEKEFDDWFIQLRSVQITEVSMTTLTQYSH